MKHLIKATQQQYENYEDTTVIDGAYIIINIKNERAYCPKSFNIRNFLDYFNHINELENYYLKGLKLLK